MTKIKLSNFDIQEQFPNAKNLGDLIGAIESNLLKEDQVLCAIFVNGEKLTAESELDQAQLSLAKIAEIEFESNQIYELLNETLHLLKTQFSYMTQISHDTSFMFRTGAQKEAHENFADLIMACEQTVEALVQIQMLLSNRKVDGIFPEEWASVAMLFQQVITDMVKAYENQDTVAVADYLEAKFPTSLKHWSQFVSRITELVEYGLARSHRSGEPQLPQV